MIGESEGVTVADLSLQLNMDSALALLWMGRAEECVTNLALVRSHHPAEVGAPHARPGYEAERSAYARLARAFRGRGHGDAVIQRRRTVNVVASDVLENLVE